jgi:hypothetical protein
MENDTGGALEIERNPDRAKLNPDGHPSFLENPSEISCF